MAFKLLVRTVCKSNNNESTIYNEQIIDFSDRMEASNAAIAIEQARDMEMEFLNSKLSRVHTEAIKLF